MSLCTLPQPVQKIKISPTANVALFITSTHISLCQKSGQQVWSVKTSTQHEIDRIEFTPNGELFCLIYKDFTAEIRSIENGRPLPNSNAFENVSFVEFDAQNQLSTISSPTGEISFFLYGNLKMGSLQLSKEKISCVTHTEYNFYVAQGKRLTQIKRQNKTQVSFSPQVEETLKLLQINDPLQLKNRHIYSIAMPLKLVHSLVTHANEVFNSIQEISNLNSELLGDMEPQFLLMLVKFYVYEQVLNKEWIRMHHEQGFKIWFKKCESAWQKLISNLNSFRMCFEQLYQLGVIEEDKLKLLINLQGIAFNRDIFLSESFWLERLISFEIDRTMHDTPKPTIDCFQNFEDLVKYNPLGTPELEFGQKLLDFSNEVKFTCEQNGETERLALLNEIEVYKNLDFDGEILEMKLLGDQCGIITPSKLILVNDRCEIIEEKELQGSKHKFVSGFDVIGLGEKSLIFGREELELDFEPSEVSVRDGMACVLSNDCQHYQFVDLTILNDDRTNTFSER